MGGPIRYEKDMESKFANGEITPLKYYLYQAGLTTWDLAEKTKLNVRTLEAYVSGRRDIRGINFEAGIKIAEVLNVEPAKLIPPTINQFKT